MPKAGTVKLKGGKNADYYEISMRQITQQILPAGLAADHRLGLRRGQVGQQERPADPQRAFADHRGAGEPAGAGQVDQRPEGCERQLPAAPAAGRSDAALGEPARRDDGPRHPPDLRRDTRPYTGPVPMVHPRARRGRRRRRQRRLRRGMVPAGGEQHPGRLRRPRAPGTTSSRARRRQATAPPGGPASRPSSTRTSTAPPRSGITTTRWA